MTVVCLDLERDKLCVPEVQIVKKETTTVKTHSGREEKADADVPQRDPYIDATHRGLLGTCKERS